jgi:uncharacterized membrane protein
MDTHASTMTDRIDSGWDPPHREAHSQRERAEGRAKALAAFSLGLGLAQTLAPDKMARLIGVRDTPSSRNLMRAIGARELLAGVGILARPSSSTWVWARVLGDVMDLALLGNSVASGHANKARLVSAAAAVVGVTTLDALSASRLSRQHSVQKLGLPIHVLKSITINRSPAEVYSFWRDIQNLPRFMAHLESVTVKNGRSVWRAKAPAGLHVEWEAEVVLDRPNEAIGWRSVEGTLVPNRGVVRFQPAAGNRGTQVTVELKYEPPGGAIGAAIAKLFGEEPKQQIAGDLRRLKQVLETGEVVHSDASIHSGMHPARPSDKQVHLLGKVDS